MKSTLTRSKLRSVASAPASVSSWIRRVASHPHGIHARGAPIVEPHFKDNQHYIPVEYDGRKATVVPVGYTLIAAPVFGQKWPAYLFFVANADLNALAITPIAQMGDAIGGTGGPWDGKVGVYQSANFVGGADPFQTYGLATYPLTYNRGYPATGQFLGGFTELQVSTTLNGTATLWCCNDSIPAIGRKAAVLRTQGVNTQYGIEEAVKMRNISMFDNLGDLLSSYKNVMLTGLQSRNFRSFMVPVVPNTMTLGGPYDDPATYHDGSNDPSSILFGCMPSWNPLAGFGQTGAMWVLQNTGSDPIPITLTTHFKSALVPATQGYIANAADGMVLLNQFTIRGRSNPSMIDHMHNCTPADTTEYASGSFRFSDSMSSARDQARPAGGMDPSICKVAPVASSDSGFHSGASQVMRDISSGVNTAKDLWTSDLGKDIRGGISTVWNWLRSPAGKTVEKAGVRTAEALAAII